MHDAMVRKYEGYRRCIIDCSNDGTPEQAIDDLVALIERVASLIPPARQHAASALKLDFSGT